MLLYEAATASRPFVGKTGANVTSAILRDPPEPLPSSLPQAVSGIVLRCLAKEPGRRYQRAGEVRAVVEAMSGTTGGWAIRSRPDGERAETARTPTQPSRSRVRPGLVLALSAAALAGLLVGAFVVGWLPRSPDSAGSSALDPIRSIAVLPFENLSGDPDDEYFADGIHDALITELAQLSGLRRGIARTSVLGYVDTDRLLQDIAQELGVEGVMTGSVLRVGDQIRITAQLIDAAAEGLLWAEGYERDLRDVLALQNEIVTDIAREIELQLTPEEQGRLASAPQVDPETHELYLLGRHEFSRLTPESLERAVDYFEQAIARDPTYAQAYAGLSLAYAESEGFGGLGRGARTEEARSAAIRAVDLDPTLAEAHASLALLKYSRDWDWAGADEAFRRAFTLNPNLARGLMDYGFYLTTMGRFEEAVAATARAVELDPLAAGLRSSHGRQLYRARRYDEAIAVYERALEFDPTRRSPSSKPPSTHGFEESRPASPRSRCGIPVSILCARTRASTLCLGAWGCRSPRYPRRVELPTGDRGPELVRRAPAPRAHPMSPPPEPQARPSPPPESTRACKPCHSVQGRARHPPTRGESVRPLRSLVVERRPGFNPAVIPSRVSRSSCTQIRTGPSWAYLDEIREI